MGYWTATGNYVSTPETMGPQAEADQRAAGPPQYLQSLIASDPKILNPAWRALNPTSLVPNTLPNASTPTRAANGYMGGTPNYSDNITSLYQSILGRAPDAGGLQNWIGKAQGGMSMQDIANAFANSAEGLARSQRLNPPPPAPASGGTASGGTASGGTATGGSTFKAPALDPNAFMVPGASSATSTTPNPSTPTTTTSPGGNSQFNDVFKSVMDKFNASGLGNTPSSTTTPAPSQNGSTQNQDPALASWMKANPGQTPNLPPSYNPQGGSAPSPQPQAPPPSGLPYGYQGLNQQPISSDLLGSLVNQANANATGGAITQNNQLRERAASSGFGPNSPAEQGVATNNLAQGMNQVAQNNLNIPLQASQYNAQYGLSGGQLGELSRSNQATEALGQSRNAINFQNTLLGLPGKILS